MVNAELFVAYIEEVLVLTLMVDDIVIMDNLPVHQVSAVRRAIQAAGAQLPFHPPYSPGLNPIEMIFAKMKPKLRHEAHRSVDAQWCALSRIAPPSRVRNAQTISATADIHSQAENPRKTEITYIQQYAVHRQQFAYATGF